MDDEAKLKARWESLGQARIAILIAALVFTVLGSFSPGGPVGQIGVIFLLMAVPVGLWEKSTRKKAGIEPAKRSSLRSAVEEKRAGDV